MDFPILDLMDPAACYQFLVGTLHPDGLRCPTCRLDDALGFFCPTRHQHERYRHHTRRPRRTRSGG